MRSAQAGSAVSRAVEGWDQTNFSKSSRREPLLARAPLRTGRASWPRIRLKHG